MGGRPGLDALLDEVAREHATAIADGLQVIGVKALRRRAFDPSWPLLLVPDESLLSPSSGAGARVNEGAGDGPTFDPPVLPGRGAHGATTADLLRALYPGEHPLLGLGGAADTSVASASDDVLAAAPHLVPALPVLDNLASPHFLPWLTARLRAPDGCPWDREQTHESLRPFLLEESYEVYDALERGAGKDLAEELGDLLLQIVLHAEHAAEEGTFDLTDVYRGIGGKIVRRHPHVFGDVRADSADQVIKNWEQIKRAERERAERERAERERVEREREAAEAAVDRDAAADREAASAPDASSRAATPSGAAASPNGLPPDAAMPAAFKGLARSLPALAYSQEMQTRAAALGYDWPDIEGVIEKLEEEALELIEAETNDQRREEFGDLLTVIVSLGRKLGIDAESALRAGNAKFARRFARVEQLAAERDRPLNAMTFEELDELWDAAKAAERQEAAG